MLMSEQASIFLEHGGSTPAFSLTNHKTYARVCSLYDADTLNVVIPIFGSFYKFSIRMMGIDTCEIRAKNVRNKELAVRARTRLYELITGNNPDPSWKKKDFEHYFDKEVIIVYLHCFEFDKWGRVLANVFSDDMSTKSFSDVLIDEKLAYPYKGDTKLTEEQQVEYMTT